MAKKLLIACNLLIALILFSSASSFWEGSSSADFYGALPERGFYVGSNSFPRNTVVDIVNLETGKTIQAIVVDNSSSTAGSAVILSRDAAEALGMGSRSSVRIRISPPADSVAFSRFSDGRSFSGDPDYDPKAFVRANVLPVETDARGAPPAKPEETGSPPPIKIIPDPVKDTGPVQVAPLPAEPELAQVDVPSTTYPLLSPSEPMPFFMPPPLPTAVFVEDESPAPEPPPEQEIAQVEIPSTVFPPLLPPEPAAVFRPMPLPDITAFEADAPVEVAQESSPGFDESESPEISEVPYPLSIAGQTAALPFPNSPEYVAVPELEPENPFPDVSPLYRNPVDYNNSVDIVLDEAVADKLHGNAEQGDPFEGESSPPELSMPSQTPYERAFAGNLDEVDVEELAAGENREIIEEIFDEESLPETTLPVQPPREIDIAETLAEAAEAIEEFVDTPDVASIYQIPVDEYADGRLLEAAEADKLARWEDAFGEELPPELSMPSQTPYEKEVARDLAEAIEEMSDAPDVITYQNPSEGYIPAGGSLDEAVIGDIHAATEDSEVSGEESPPELAMPGSQPYERDSEKSIELANGAFENLDNIPGIPGIAEASLMYAEPGMSGEIGLSDGLWVLKNGSGQEYVLGAALQPESDYFAGSPGSSGPEGELYDAIFRGESLAEAALSYAEPGMSGTLALSEGRWILRDEDGEDRIISSGLPPEEVLALIEMSEGMIGGLPEALAREGAAAESGIAEASLMYAEPGMSGRIDLVDGRWVLKDKADGGEYLLPVPYGGVIGGLPEALARGFWDGEVSAAGYAESDLPYAEPGMEGRIELSGGRWVLKDNAEAEYAVSFLSEVELAGILPEALLRGVSGPAEASLMYAEPGMSGTLELADGRWILRDDADVEYSLPAPYGQYGQDLVRLLLPGLRDGAQDALPYAEPGMSGTLELADGRWILRDDADVEYSLPAPYGQDLVRLLLPGLRDGAQDILPYAEPGMSGTLELADGRWILRDDADVEYSLPAPYGQDLVRLLLPGLREGAQDALPYAEPGMSGTLELADGRWILRDDADVEYTLPAPYGQDLVRLLLPGLRDGAQDILPYAEPGMSGTLELADGRWILRDDADVEYSLPAPYGQDLVRLLLPGLREGAQDILPYAEPGMSGTLELADGRWILRDDADVEYSLPAPYGQDLVRLLLPGLRDGAQDILPYAEPGMSGTLELADGRWILRDDADVEYSLPAPYGQDLVRLLLPGLREGARDILPYAEPGMSGVLALSEGRWILRDDAGVEYSLPPPYGQDLVRLLLPGLREGARDILPYAEPGMSGVLALSEGRWILRDDAGVEYSLPTPYGQDLVRLLLPGLRDGAQDALPYAEPGMSGTLELAGGRWILRSDADENYLILFSLETGIALFPAMRSVPAAAENASELSNLIYILTGNTESADSATVNLGQYIPYPFDDTFVNAVLANDESAIRNIYEAIVRIESAPNRPPEVIIDLGPIREEYGVSMLELLPKSMLDTKDAKNASLLLIKQLSNDKYYLQIGLFDRKDALVWELINLSWVYPYALETSGNSQTPTYKLLVGPVNEGESNALLLRFKRYGYHDAFIRKEG
jgi:hypothetical protein